jgi:Na+-translocating ferredoxin:NAD+ oxidoreductase RnfG subunit
MAAVAAALLALAGWQAARIGPPETLFEGHTKPPEPGPLCPWRQPDTDLKTLFPSATRYEVETRILSGKRTELAQRLDRAPTGDENALRFYRVYRENTALGTVLTRRVKGEYGAIELVLATDAEERVSGMRLQRLREPEPIASALENSAWQESFRGKEANSPWHLDQQTAELPVVAQGSARAVAEGVRSLLVLLATANSPGTPSLAAGHHH